MMKENKTREEGDILKEIRKNATREKEVVQALKKENGLTWEEDGVVYMEGRIYVPNNKKIKEEILKKNHDLVDVGHPEQYRMLGTKRQLSMAYHPQTDGQMERINQEIGTFLRHYVNY